LAPSPSAEHRRDAGTKGQQPWILVNPLRHNGIIGSASAKVKDSPCVATVLEWEVTNVTDRLGGKEIHLELTRWTAGNQEVTEWFVFGANDEIEE
jgi:hypothetical protein